MTDFNDELQTVVFDENERNVFVGTASVIGKRNEQQDSVVADDCCQYMENGKMIAILCDGMGGLAGGAKASSLCATLIYNLFYNASGFDTVPQFYKAAVYRADEEVCDLKDDDGTPILNSGTTLASVVIADNHLYWAGVGDSRIYILRGQEMLCITKDHNYMMILKELAERGEITQEQADTNPKKEALISYIGMGGVRLIDMNAEPFVLKDGDHIILCSDGLYRSVEESEIKQVVLKYMNETQVAAEQLVELAMSKGNIHQDNTSVIVIGYQDTGKCNV